MARILSSIGYLPAVVFGYAFALFAFMRGEQTPKWAGSLCLNVSTALRSGLRYLHETNDSLFHPDTIDLPRGPLTSSAAVAGLSHASATVRLATLWELRTTPLADTSVVAAAAACLDDRDPHIPGEAARTLTAFGSAASDYVPRLREAAGSPNPRTRLEAIAALGVLREDPDKTVPFLTTFLNQPVSDWGVALQAVGALCQFGALAEGTVPRLLDLLPEPLNSDDDNKVEIVLRALLTLAPNPEQSVREHFQEHDAETCSLALEALAELREYLAGEIR